MNPTDFDILCYLLTQGQIPSNSSISCLINKQPIFQIFVCFSGNFLSFISDLTPFWFAPFCKEVTPGCALYLSLVPEDLFSALYFDFFLRRLSVGLQLWALFCFCICLCFFPPHFFPVSQFLSSVRNQREGDEAYVGRVLTLCMHVCSETQLCLTLCDPHGL